jgi:hypothetical protein
LLSEILKHNSVPRSKGENIVHFEDLDVEKRALSVYDTFSGFIALLTKIYRVASIATKCMARNISGRGHGTCRAVGRSPGNAAFSLIR